MKRRKGIGLEPTVYPDGTEHVCVFLDDERAGWFEVREGGYLVLGCRKPCRTQNEAVRKILTREAKKAHAEAVRYEKALAELPGGAEGSEP